MHLFQLIFIKEKINNILTFDDDDFSSISSLSNYNSKLNIDSAKVNYKKALSLSKEVGNKSFEARILIKLGEIYATSSNNEEKEKGEKYITDCINLSKFYNFKDIFYKAHLIYSKYLINSNRFTEAELNLYLLVGIINHDILYAYDNSLEEELFYIIDEIFSMHLSLLSTSQNIEKNSKTGKIFELMQHKEYFKIQDMMNNMNLNFVDFNMNFYYNDMVYSKDKVKYLKSSYINAVQFNLKNNQDLLLQEISRENGIYKKLSYNSPTHKKLFSNDLLTVNEVKNSLSADDIFITYYGSSEHISCLVFNKDKETENIKININIDEIKNITKLNNYLNNSLDISSLSKELFKILIEPIFPLAINKKNIIFYSNVDVLNNFPFDLLEIDEKFINQKESNKNLLIDNFNIAQLSYIFEIKKNILNNKSKNNDYKEIYSFVNAYSAVTEDLKFADKEYNSLKWEFDIANNYSGKEALESTFYNLSLSKIDSNKQLFHFPTHTFINKKDTLESYISLVNDKDFDGKLGYSEILEYDNRNRDIVLSGCETGGKIAYDYNNYFDISSAFILSGSESVVSTRWKTSDLITSVLMKRYFRYLKEGNSKIEALSRAKRIVKNYVKSYPYYWAGFKISGDFR